MRIVEERDDRYYKLKKDLPTYKAGEIFFTIPGKGLRRVSDKSVAYSTAILNKNPNILTDWFEEIPAPERDSKTKFLFMRYLSEHKGERFFQAIKNFTHYYLDKDTTVIASGYNGIDTEWDDELDTFVDCDAVNYMDTFYWDCDGMLKEYNEHILEED